jgi:hypothetical protein
MPRDETQETIERGEYGVILLEGCIIHLFEDNANSPADLSQYDGEKSGSFFLRRSQLHALIAKLRNSAPPS